MKHKGIKNFDPKQRQRIKKEILQRQLSKCAICLKSFHLYDRMTFDHVIPLAKGGTNHDNLQIVHYHCNQEKGAL